MTAKQKAAREKFKKVVAEAAKLRKKNPKLTQAQAVKQAFAINYSKAGESKKVAAPKKKSAHKKKSAPKKVGYKYDRTSNLYEATALVKKYQKEGLKRQAAIKKANFEVAKSKLSGIKNKYTNKQLEKIANDYAYVTSGDVDKLTYRLLDKDNTEKLLPVYLKSIFDFEKKYKTKISGIKKKAGAASSKVKAKKGKSTEMHTDTKSHNVNIRVVSGMDSVNDQAIRQLHDAGSKLISWNKILRLLEDKKLKTSGVEKTMLMIDIKRVKSAIKEQKTHMKELQKHIK